MDVGKEKWFVAQQTRTDHMQNFCMQKMLARPPPDVAFKNWGVPPSPSWPGAGPSLLQATAGVSGPADHGSKKKNGVFGRLMKIAELCISNALYRAVSFGRD